jgi:chaperonin GroES
MNLKPLGERVLVKPLKEEEKQGGIIIPDTAKEKPQEGVVEAVGPGKLADTGDRLAMNVKKGDKVLFGKYSGTEVKIGDTEYLIMNEDDIFGTVE